MAKKKSSKGVASGYSKTKARQKTTRKTGRKTERSVGPADGFYLLEILGQISANFPLLSRALDHIDARLNVNDKVMRNVVDNLNDVIANTKPKVQVASEADLLLLELYLAVRETMGLDENGNQIPINAGGVLRYAEEYLTRIGKIIPTTQGSDKDVVSTDSGMEAVREEDSSGLAVEGDNVPETPGGSEIYPEPEQDDTGEDSI